MIKMLNGGCTQNLHMLRLHLTLKQALFVNFKVGVNMCDEIHSMEP